MIFTRFAFHLAHEWISQSFVRNKCIPFWGRLRSFRHVQPTNAGQEKNEGKEGEQVGMASFSYQGRHDLVGPDQLQLFAFEVDEIGGALSDRGHMYTVNHIQDIDRPTSKLPINCQ